MASLHGTPSMRSCNSTASPHLLHPSLRRTLPPSLAPTRAVQPPHNRQLHGLFLRVNFTANNRCRTPRVPTYSRPVPATFLIPSSSSSPIPVLPPFSSSPSVNLHVFSLTFLPLALPFPMHWWSATGFCLPLHHAPLCLSSSLIVQHACCAPHQFLHDPARSVAPPATPSLLTAA